MVSVFPGHVGRGSHLFPGVQWSGFKSSWLYDLGQVYCISLSLRFPLCDALPTQELGVK
jgi:hypothetical protein